MKNSILVIILLVGVALLGYILINKQNTIENQTQNQDTSFSEEDTQITPTTQTQNNNQGSNINTEPTQTTSTQPTNPPVTISPEYKNDQLGFSFNYPVGIGNVSLEIASGDEGKMIVGRICDGGTGFCMFIGGTTPVIKFPGELNANEVSSYPTPAQLQQLSDRGYKNEIKINSKGEEYILIYGQKEVDMPYISEGQMVAIFKLKSSVDFKALGFMLVEGESDIFLDVINKVDIY